MAKSKSHYVRGTMPIDGHEKTFTGFMKLSAFATAFWAVVLLFPILALCTPLGWLISLIITFVIGLLIAPLFKLGGNWYGTLIGLAVLGAVLSLIFSALN